MNWKQTNKLRKNCFYNRIHLQIDGNAQPRLVESLDHVEPRQHWSLVVGRSSPIEFAVLLDQLEWIRIPAIVQRGWLHIQMAVNTDGLLLRVRPQSANQNGRQRYFGPILIILVAQMTEVTGDASCF